MLTLSRKAYHLAIKNINNNQKSFVSTSTNYPATSRLKTQTPQLLTERTRTLNPENNNENSKNKDKQVVFSKTIDFQTIKKKVIFNKNSIKRHMQSQKEKLYRSLDSHDGHRDHSKQIIRPQIQKNVKMKTPIQMKNSNSIQGFFKSKVKAYGISTFKSQNSITNHHFMSVHLGKVKQFLLIQNVDGFSAGTLVKKSLPIDVLKYHLENTKKQVSKYKKDTFQVNNLEDAVIQAFQQINKKILESQRQLHDNSGCFIHSVFITQNYILSANCGTGSTFYFTKQQKFKQLGSIHSTFNMNQLQRITKHKGKIYQTQFNLKLKKQMGIKGPIRVYPNGTTYTRILGKTFDKINRSCQDQPVYTESPISQQPQISYVKAQNIQWIVLLSSGIVQFLSKTLICSIVLHQIGKYGLTFTVHDLAGECSKAIINQAILRGFSQTMSVEVIILNLNTERLDLYDQLHQDKQKQQKLKLKRQPQSLKYIGKRKNFVIDFKK